MKRDEIILCENCIDSQKPRERNIKENHLNSIPSIRIHCKGCDERIAGKFYLYSPDKEKV